MSWTSAQTVSIPLQNTGESMASNLGLRTMNGCFYSPFSDSVLNGPERKTLEFKPESVTAGGSLKFRVAFANTAGGTGFAREFRNEARAD
jgi:hypothetical protein